MTEEVSRRCEKPWVDGTCLDRLVAPCSTCSEAATGKRVSAAFGLGFRQGVMRAVSHSVANCDESSCDVCKIVADSGAPRRGPDLRDSIGSAHKRLRGDFR